MGEADGGRGQVRAMVHALCLRGSVSPPRGRERHFTHNPVGG